MNSLESGESNCLAIEGSSVLFYHRRKKQSPVLNALDIHVPKGSIYGLLGPSGCGKTTLLKCIVGYWKPKGGVIRVYGKKFGHRHFCIPGRGVGYMPQELALYHEFSIGETLTYFGRLYQMDFDLINARVEFLLKFLDMPAKTRVVKNLSCGQQRRVSLAAALIHKPPLLILDEPTVGVDPLLRHSIWEYLVTMSATDHITIIITTHYVEEARKAQMVGLMREGRLLAEMNPEILIKKHNRSTLEDVFLKLCREDSAKENLAEATKENSPVHDEEQPSQDFAPDVWISLQAVNGKSSLRPALNNYENNPGDGVHNKALISNHMANGNALCRELSCAGQAREAKVRMSTLVTKGFIRLKRNIPLAFLQIFIPVIQYVVFCFCIGGDLTNLKLAVVNMETDPLGFGHQLLRSIDNKIILQIPKENMSLGIELIWKAEVWGALYIGPKFSECLTDRFLESIDASNKTISCSTIYLNLDMTNPVITAVVYKTLMQGYQAFAAEMLESTYGNSYLAQPPMVINPIFGSKELNISEFFAPGVILAIVYFMAMALTGVIIISEKTEGLLERSWMAGVTHAEIIFSIMLVYFFVMVLQVALILVYHVLAFDTPLHGSAGWFIFSLVLTGLNGMAYGLFVSTLCNTESSALILSTASFIPSLLISGIIWPLEGMPYWLQYLSSCLPLTIPTKSVRSLIYRGWSVTEGNVWLGFTVPGLWTVGFLIISWLIFKYKK